MGAENKRRDVVSFVLLAVFAASIYAVPGELISWTKPLRLALTTSGLAAFLMVARRIGQMQPIFLDGAKGIALVCFVVLSFASIGWAINPEVARTEALEFLKISAIYLTMVNVLTTPKRLYVFCGALVMASIITSIGAIQTYVAGVGLVEGFRTHWIGVYADPNHMAMALVLIVPIATAFVARQKTPQLLRLLCGIAVMVSVSAIVLSYSRGGFIGLSIAMAIWALREKQRRTQAIVLGFVLAMGLVVFAPKNFWTRNETLGSFHEDASAMGRVFAWEVASRISVDKPLLGVGIGGFRYAWPLYAPAESHRAYVGHNVYLDVIGELGFVGLFFFLIFTGGAMASAFESSSDEEVGWLARALAGSVCGYLICDMFSGYLLSSHFYVLFALAACCERIARERLTASETVPEHIYAEPLPGALLGLQG